jgi:hypothetical protein
MWISISDFSRDTGHEGRRICVGGFTMLMRRIPQP